MCEIKSGNRQIPRLPVRLTQGMKHAQTGMIYSLLFVSLVVVASADTELTAKGEKLRKKYAAMLADLRADIIAAAPTIDEKQSAAFMEAYAAVGEARGNAWKVKDYAATLKPVAKAQEKALEIAEPMLTELKPFLTSDDLDPKLVKCAVLTNATPKGLAEFAQQGNEEQALVEKLLADTDLMNEMLKAGGARCGKYGEAMRIYTGIMNASEHARKGGIFQRFALGTSLELAVPIVERSRTQMKAEEKTNVDPVKRYLNYEKAFLNGELDPGFKTLTTWECRFVPKAQAPDEELAWGRKMLRNYRPDHIFTEDYRWRYSKIVKSDVKYMRSDPPIPELGFYQNIPNMGGVCGRRAFFGRFILRAFGIPTFGIRQRGHAALSHWTPDGWTINFGAHWHWSWWDRPGHTRSGMDFLLETQAREYPEDYMQVLRAQWVGDALGEEDVDGRKLGSGGLWNALALYKKRAIVKEEKPEEVELAGEDLAEANVSTKAENIIKADIGEANRQINIDKDGVITIPAVACKKPTNSTKKIRFMKSFDGGMQLHYQRLHKPETFEYTFKAPEDGEYKLVARVVTVHNDQQLLLTTNGTDESIEIAVPYTVGMWEKTKPVQIPLNRGENKLSFTCKAPNFGVTIKDFTLTPVK